jgi:hypothetical protein
MGRVCLQIAMVLLYAGAAAGAPITIGGFNFAAGEQAFADDAFLVSGTIRLCGGGFPVPSSVAEALSGSNVTDCVNNNTGNSGIVELLFTDNLIVNAAGADLVIFELSGPLSPGTPDPRERFELSVFDGTTFTALQLYGRQLLWGSGPLPRTLCCRGRPRCIRYRSKRKRRKDTASRL